MSQNTKQYWHVAWDRQDIAKYVKKSLSFKNVFTFSIIVTSNKKMLTTMDIFFIKLLKISNSILLIYSFVVQLGCLSVPLVTGMFM